MRATVVEEGNTLEDGKNPAEVEVDKSLAEESKIPAGQVQQLGGAEKTRVSADAEDPPRDCGAEQTHLLDVVEEEDDLKKVQLQKKKAKKRKKSELEEIKKEKQYGDVETQVQQLGAVEKTQVSADAEDPSSNCGAEQTHLLDVVEEDDDSKNVQLQKKKVKKRKRRELEQIKEEVLVEAGVPLRWCASYYTLLLHSYETPRYKGSIVLDPELNRVALRDTNETTIDCRYLEEGELIYPGLVLEFACHKAEIDNQNLQVKEDLPKKKRNKKDIMDEKKRSKLKRKRSDETARELTRNQQPLSSPQAKLVGSSIGMFARVAALRKRISPQVQGRKSESPSVPNVTAHFTSPNLPRVGADFTRRQPRKLKSRIWKDFVPIYEHGKVVEGQCNHCNEVFPASASSGTNHIHRHIKKCETRRSMHEMVSKIRASSSSPKVLALDSWNFSQKESRRDLTNMIVHHGLPFSIVEYSGFRKFVKSLNPMFKMVSRTTIGEDCFESYKEQRSILRETLKNCGARVSLTADMWTSNQRLGYMCITCHYIDKTWKMQKRILRFCMMETPHNGYQMYNTMLKSLQYWNIEDKICNITLDNASVNGSMMDYLKENLMKKHMLRCGGILFHICCAAHVLNLVVQDGLLVMKGHIDNIRERQICQEFTASRAAI